MNKKASPAVLTAVFTLFGTYIGHFGTPTMAFILGVFIAIVGASVVSISEKS